MEEQIPMEFEKIIIKEILKEFLPKL